jgi:ubiquinone/menaquinone biosynthesis C-methylase UbiE
MALHDSVEREYGELAGEYDARWAGYVRGSVERVLRDLRLAPGEVLLDVGCGTGVLLEGALRGEPEARGCGVDLSAEMLGVARRRLRGRAGLVRADAEVLPFRDAAFDAVASSSALHYWPTPERALREMARVLRPGGRLALTDWSADWLGIRALGWLLRATRRPLGRILRAAEMEALLRASGFTEVAVERYRVGWWGMLAATARRASP